MHSTLGLGAGRPAIKARAVHIASLVQWNFPAVTNSNHTVSGRFEKYAIQRLGCAAARIALDRDKPAKLGNELVCPRTSGGVGSRNICHFGGSGKDAQ